MQVEGADAVCIAAAVVTLAAGGNNGDGVTGKRAISATATPVGGMIAGITVAAFSRTARPVGGGVNEGPDNESAERMAIQGVGARNIRIVGHGDRHIRNTRFVASCSANGIHLAETSPARTVVPQLRAVRLAANDAASAERAILRNIRSVPRDMTVSGGTAAATQQVAAAVATPLVVLRADDVVQVKGSALAPDDFEGGGQAVSDVAKL